LGWFFKMPKFSLPESSKCWKLAFKELNPRRRVYVEIPKPSRVSLKLRQNNIFHFFEGGLVVPPCWKVSLIGSQYQPESILALGCDCPKSKHKPDTLLSSCTISQHCYLSLLSLCMKYWQRVLCLAVRINKGIRRSGLLFNSLEDCLNKRVMLS
jgi:hypothetical protein